ncbi:MAG TPA: hypothetical protein VK658_08945 [Chryseolinea sp.]|nr:hypothetical protein [Chryseolinea sp.]
MTRQDTRHALTRLLRRYKTTRLVEILLFAVAAGLVIFPAIDRLTRPVPAIVISAVVAIGVCIVRLLQLRLFQIDEESMARYVNRQLPQLQESGDLLLREPGELTVLEQLQQQRAAKQFADLRGTLRLPHQLYRAVLALIAGTLIASVMIFAFDRASGRVSLQEPVRQRAPAIGPVLPGSVRQLSIQLSPPAYTHLKDNVSLTFPIAAPEGSQASWSVLFSAPVQNACIVFDGHDTLALHASGDRYAAQRKLVNSGFYQLMWQATDGQQKHSDFYPIQLLKDVPPTLKIDNLEQFIQLEAAGKRSVDLHASLSDDYGLARAYLIATVSKGSGEGIKFREERLRFDAPARIEGKKLAATRHIDLAKLGLDPGDELYYYIEAFDNKTPSPNRARTETYFIALRDTSEITTSVDPGLGVDLMPEYFRSQRQIIIDSEKLLKEKNRITRAQFNARSNDLAHDEKVLRLRYGEFLGEEFETSIGPSAGADAPVSSETDIVKQYGHQHDTDEEHAARVEAPAKPGEQHSHGTAHAKDEDPSKAYLHAHDSEEEATFFTQSIRAKLKAAVTIMWDAELHLRLYTPEKSLPYQYQALKLLKEISQDSRIYVHRTGFDPPPLKEDKRLSGDLAEVRSSVATTRSVDRDEYPAIRRALSWLEGTAEADSVTAIGQELLQQAGTELSGAAMRQPGRYLRALSLLRAYRENEIPKPERNIAWTTIREAFYQVLPTNASHPTGHKRTAHPLEDRFLKNYDALPKELTR